ncbi:MAG: DeoR/GlpR family DNA-binding transcription regulator [Blautia sp.]
MISSEREQMILDYLEKHNIASTHHLCELTKASIATVRRDLNSMSKRGLILKTHGGAKQVPKAVSAQILPDPDQDDPFFSEKDAIARTAARFICPGDIIFLGAGKTCTLIARYIKEKEDITIVTTNLNLVFELASSKNSMLLLGGDIHVGSNYIETLGEYTLEEMNRLYFDKVFFTVNGIDLDSGYSITSRSQLPLYHYLMKNCKASYVAADSGKFGCRAFTQLCALDEIPHAVISPRTPTPYLEYYKTHNIQVCLSDQYPKQ